MVLFSLHFAAEQFEQFEEQRCDLLRARVNPLMLDNLLQQNIYCISSPVSFYL